MRLPNAPPGFMDHPVPVWGGTTPAYIRTGMRFAISWDYCAEYPCQRLSPGNGGGPSLASAFARGHRSADGTAGPHSQWGRDCSGGPRLLRPRGPGRNGRQASPGAFSPSVAGRRRLDSPARPAEESFAEQTLPGKRTLSVAVDMPRLESKKALPFFATRRSIATRMGSRLPIRCSCLARAEQESRLPFIALSQN